MKKYSFTSLNMILRPLRLLPLNRTAVFLMTFIMLQNVNSKPQQPSVFENVASQSLAIAGKAAEMIGDAGMISKKMDFEIPFAKAKSESKAGTGAAFRNYDDDSESDSVSEEDRRKRSTDFQVQENTLIGEESLLPLPLNHQHHFHRGKRSPCHTYGGGGGGGTGGGDVPADGDVIDTVRRLRAYARKRKAAAKKAKSTKKLINDDDEGNQALTRRKRQSEADDLNQTMQKSDNDFAQYAQQVAEKIRQTFDTFVTSMNDMAQKLKQHFSGQNATNTMEI